MIGMAGYGEDLKIREKIEASVFKVFPAIIMNDAHFAHISALNNQDGVLVISGTGSIAFHKKNNEFSRKGGFGYLIDDGGSGFGLVNRFYVHFQDKLMAKYLKPDYILK